MFHGRGSPRRETPCGDGSLSQAQPVFEETEPSVDVHGAIYYIHTARVDGRLLNAALFRAVERYENVDRIVSDR